MLIENILINIIIINFVNDIKLSENQLTCKENSDIIKQIEPFGYNSNYKKEEYRKLHLLMR